MSLARAKLRARDEVDFLAGEARSRHITESKGQEMVYLKKLEQAKWYADEYAANSNCYVPPILSMEASAIGVTPISLAQTVISNGDAWFDVTCPTIESIRIKAKADISEQADLSSVASVLAQARAALNAI